MSMISERPAALIDCPPDRLRAQVVILGSGPGGSVAASLLAAAGRDVLLVEEGPYIPQSACRLYSREEMELRYRNGGLTLAIGGPKITYVEGKCVGGGSEINAGLYYRTPDEVLERWQRDFRVERLDTAGLAPHFESIEKTLDVTTTPDLTGVGNRLRVGAEKLGVSSLDSQCSLRPPTIDDDESASEGQRASMTRTFLPQAFRAGARLLPDTRARSFRREGGRWVVRCRHATGAEPAREIVVEAESLYLACGAIHTPALLRRSGIRRNVGNSLAMQATVKVTARFGEVVNQAGTGVPTHAVDAFAPRYTFTCASSSPSYLALEMLQYPGHTASVAEDWPRMAVYSARIAGGVGSVRNLPGFRDPIVRYRVGPEDLRTLSEATRKLCELLFAAGAECVYPSLLLGEPLRGPGDLDRIPMPLERSITNLMTIHLSSSCPMGEAEDRCAVDSFGRVHGADDLYVADGSLLCTSPTVNPQGSIMAIVRRNVLQQIDRA